MKFLGHILISALLVAKELVLSGLAYACLQEIAI